MRDKRFVGEADHYDIDWVFDTVGTLCNEVIALKKMVKTLKKKYKKDAATIIETLDNVRRVGEEIGKNDSMPNN